MSRRTVEQLNEDEILMRSRSIRDRKIGISATVGTIITTPIPIVELLKMRDFSRIDWAWFATLGLEVVAAASGLHCLSDSVTEQVEANSMRREIEERRPSIG